MFQQLNSTFKGDMPPLNYNDKIVMMHYIALNGNDTVITNYNPRSKSVES